MVSLIILLFVIQYNYCNQKKHLFNLFQPRVAHSLGSLDIGGTERGVSVITELFADRNISMIILTLFKAQKEYKLSPKVKRFVVQSKLKGTINIDYKFIKRILIKNKINILVNHITGNIANKINKIAHIIGIKVIFFSHSTFVDVSYNYQNSFLSLKNYDIYISLVNFNVLYMSSIRKLNSLLIHNQMNFLVKNNLSKFTHNKNIIMVGRPTEAKNYEFAIEVFSQVVKEIKDAKLQIVGLIRDKNINYIKKIINKIRNLDLNKNIIVTKASLDLELFYKNSSIYLMCSYYEGFPNVVSEAKSYGLATIIVGVTYITPANNGTINIFNYDKKATAKKIVELFSNETYLNEMRKFAFENREEISNDELLEIWMKIYNSLIKNNVTNINKLKNKLNNYSDKRYLELDKIIIREREDKIKHRVFY